MSFFVLQSLESKALRKRSDVVNLFGQKKALFLLTLPDLSVGIYLEVSPGARLCTSCDLALMKH